MASTLAAPGSSRDPTVASLGDIKERLDESERMFPLDGQDELNNGEGWEEKKTRRRPVASRRRDNHRRTTRFSENRALVKGIYVVAKGLRCAYLVDTVPIDKNRAEILGNYFSSIPAYKDVAFLFEERTEQVYIVNMPLLRALSERFQKLNPTTTLEEAGMLWMQVDADKPSIPARMRQSLEAQIHEQIAKNWKIPLRSPQESSPANSTKGQIRMLISPTDFPGLSAWLLEYPVGYTFSDDGSKPRICDSEAETSTTQRTNLDGESLVLVKVKILGEKELGGSYDLIAFSYPAKWLEPEGEESSPGMSGTSSTPSRAAIRNFLQSIPIKLKERYESRLGVEEGEERPRIEVSSERVRLEKVVL